MAAGDGTLSAWIDRCLNNLKVMNQSAILINALSAHFRWSFSKSVANSIKARTPSTHNRAFRDLGHNKFQNGLLRCYAQFDVSRHAVLFLLKSNAEDQLKLNFSLT